MANVVSSTQPNRPPAHLWLRLEAAALLAASVACYSRSGASWWIFAALFFLPDLSMIAYAAGPTHGAHAYNAVHTYALPLLLAAAAALSGHAGWLPIAAICAAHIAMDRALGYGLKDPRSFHLTHLGPIGRTPAQ